MVLDRQGGPNWFKNWCVAPVIVDPDQDEVYFTPLYYVMSHFSRFIRPGAVRTGLEVKDSDIMCTAALNPDGSIAVIVFNPEKIQKAYRVNIGSQSFDLSIQAQAIQTLIISTT
jgi:glucosylceramidase